jgi:hypothetical protein
MCSSFSKFVSVAHSLKVTVLLKLLVVLPALGLLIQSLDMLVVLYPVLNGDFRMFQK